MSELDRIVKIFEEKDGDEPPDIPMTDAEMADLYAIGILWRKSESFRCFLRAVFVGYSASCVGNYKQEFGVKIIDLISLIVNRNFERKD